MSKRRIVVLDHGLGNLHSAVRALRHVGADVELTADGAAARRAAGLLVPGVGAFAAVMAGLRAIEGEKVVADRLRAGAPVLGVCVGLQVLFEAGTEHGVRTDGLGLVPGQVRRLEADVVPNMGWLPVKPPAGSVLFNGIEDEMFYFVHSYAARVPAPGSGPVSVAGLGPVRFTTAEHGGEFAAAVEAGPLAGTQFHPEKSADAGLALLANWLRSC